MKAIKWGPAKGGWRGDAVFFQLDPPLVETKLGWDGEPDEEVPHEYVIVSAVPSAFDSMRPETYIFPANSDGTIKNWGELPGSQRGFCDVERALTELGYEVQEMYEVSEPEVKQIGQGSEESLG